LDSIRDRANELGFVICEAEAMHCHPRNASADLFSNSFTYDPTQDLASREFNLILKTGFRVNFGNDVDCVGLNTNGY